MSPYRFSKPSIFGNFEQERVHEHERSEFAARRPNARELLALRRAEPCNVVLPGTYQWAAQLPDFSVPRRLMALYPRIANRLAHSWNDLDECLAVLDDLLVDRRGGRRGFPELVRDELLRLRIARTGRHTYSVR